jgi:hypothetical protein
MESLERGRLYRIILGLAAIYNVGFGLWAGLFPHSFFDLFELDPPRYPGIWQCLGMVVGLYGLVYGYAALRLERGEPARVMVAIGLLGKVLGPAGWALAVRSGELPWKTFPLILFNDLLWWIPFSVILLEGTRVGARLRAAAPEACAAFNALAAAAMLFCLRPGLWGLSDLARRTAYLREHPFLWRGGWAAWIAATSSLLAFYAWWAVLLPRPARTLTPLCLALLGFACDMVAQSLFIGWLPDRIEEISSLGEILTGGAANGLYTLAGVLLTLESGPLPRGLRIWTWTTWAAGFALSAAAVARSAAGEVAASALLIALFCPWVLVMGRHLRRPGVGSAGRARAPEPLEEGAPR